MKLKLGIPSTWWPILALATLSVLMFEDNLPAEELAPLGSTKQMTQQSCESNQPMTQDAKLRSETESAIRDNFYHDVLPDDYEVYDGPGHSQSGQPSISKSGRVLRYQALPRGVEFAGQGEVTGRGSVIGIDLLGRPYAPSLMVARPFCGESWTLETKVRFGFDRPSNGRAISIWVVIGEEPQASKNALQIQRYNDNPGNPSQRGKLEVMFHVASGRTYASAPVPLGADDTYYLRIVRDHSNLSVLVSRDGNDYAHITQYPIEPGTNQNTQWFAINGMAFGPGAYADFEYLSVKPSAGAVLSVPRARHDRFEKSGEDGHPASVDSKEILQALQARKNVKIRFATISGALDLSAIDGLTTRIVFASSTFKDLVRGSNSTYLGDLSFIDCKFLAPVNFSGARFEKKADFSGSYFQEDTRFILANFYGDADFSGTSFKTRVFFRASRFQQPTSFYYSNLEEGADFSGCVFNDEVSFADFSFANPMLGTALSPDITFFGSTFKKSVLFISSLQRPVAPLGEEISFQESTINNLVFSSGDPDIFSPVSEQTGKGLWVIRSGVSLLDAHVETLTFKNVSFKEVVDMRGTTFGNAADTIRLVNVDFGDFRLVSWPVGKVLATPETRSRLVYAFDRTDDTIESRVAFFDLAAVSSFFGRWLRDTKDRRPKSYRGYVGFALARAVLRAFWYASAYATSLVRTLLTGVGLSVLCALSLVFLNWGGTRLVKIEKPAEIKMRPAETPILSEDDKVVPVLQTGRSEMTGSELMGEKQKVSGLRGTIRIMREIAKTVPIAVVFSLNNVLKIGFGNIRIRSESGKRSLVILWFAWGFWALGYLWYVLLLWTVSVIPALKKLI